MKINTTSQIKHNFLILLLRACASIYNDEPLMTGTSFFSFSCAGTLLFFLHQLLKLNPRGQHCTLKGCNLCCEFNHCQNNMWLLVLIYRNDKNVLLKWEWLS